MMQLIGPATPILEIYLKTNIAPQCAHRRMVLEEHFKRAYLLDMHPVIRIELNNGNVVLVPLHKVEHILIDRKVEEQMINHENSEEPSKQPAKKVRRRRKAPEHPPADRENIIHSPA